jgi:acetylornithine deacetylase
MVEDKPSEILDRMESVATNIVEEARKHAPEADIKITVTNTYPGLNTPTDADVVSFVKSLTGANGTIKVAFGTEGGLFDQDLDIPTVVCGPGSMAQGHKPDEYVSIAQLDKCDAALKELVKRLEAGL